MTPSEYSVAELQALREFFTAIDEAYDESSDAEEVDQAVKTGLDTLKAELNRVRRWTTA